MDEYKKLNILDKIEKEIKENNSDISREIIIKDCLKNFSSILTEIKNFLINDTILIELLIKNNLYNFVLDILLYFSKDVYTEIKDLCYVIFSNIFSIENDECIEVTTILI